MPTARAVKKWPASCTRIRNARPRMAMKTLIGRPPADERKAGGDRRSRGGGPSLGEAPRLGVRLDEGLEVAGGGSVDGCERLLDRVGDPEERQPALEERPDGDLVRRVVGARIGSSELAGAAGERQQRESFPGLRVVLQCQPPSPVQWGDRRGRSARACQRARG